MELIETRKMDDLGRIIIPLEIRQKEHWYNGMDISFYYAVDGSIVIAPAVIQETPYCEHCVKNRHKSPSA